MHQSVLDRFVDFTAPLEGVVPSLYVDVKQLLTVGIGCLVDPVSLALSLPWVMPDGSPASQSEIATQWRKVKADAARLSKLHWKYAAKLTTMRLTDEGVLAVARGRLLANEKIMRGHFPNWDLFPADAQLACCSMSWAIGADWPRIFGNMKAACNAQNWTAAIASCAIRTEGNPGIVPRNAANKLCLANAQQVLAQGLPLDTLFWPGTAPSSSQRDDALRVEAEQAAVDHSERLNAITAALDVAGHAGRDIADYENGPNPPNDPEIA